MKRYFARLIKILKLEDFGREPMIRLLGLALVLLFAPASLADPPKLSKILACPKDTESPKPGFCCRKGTQKPVLQRAYGVDAHCVFHGPIVYGDLALPRFTVINYEYGRLMGARWEIEDKKIHSMQEYRDSVASGTYREYDRKGRLFMEGHKDQGQLVGTWRAHIDSEKRSYVIHFNPLAESSPIQTCGLRSAKCSDVALPDAELALSHQNKVTEILGFYRPQENQYPQLFDTLETAFLPLRLGPGSDGPLLGIIVQNRLVTSWSN